MTRGDRDFRGTARCPIGRPNILGYPLALPTEHRDRRGEHPLLTNPRLYFVTTAILALATALVCVLVGAHATRPWVQRIDDRFLREMVASRTDPITAVAKVFNVLGAGAVTLPVRIAAAAYLAFRRWWRHLAAFVLAMVASEILVGTLKVVYQRQRPPARLALVGTTGSSFPSGHAVAASVTVVALVLVMVPSGPRRWVWWMAAALFSIAMAISRAYLAAHWLSDAAAGMLLGITVALGSALVVQWVSPKGSGRPPPSRRGRP